MTDPQATVTSLSNLAQSALAAGVLLRLLALLFRQQTQPLLERDREGDDGVPGVVLIDPGLDLR